MRRLLAVGCAGALLIAAAGCGPTSYPKENPRLTPAQQQEAAAAAGNEGTGDTGATTEAPAEGGDAPPAEGGG